MLVRRSVTDLANSEGGVSQELIASSLSATVTTLTSSIYISSLVLTAAGQAMQHALPANLLEIPSHHLTTRADKGMSALLLGPYYFKKIRLSSLRSNPKPRSFIHGPPAQERHIQQVCP